ncbi:PREDICTED: GATA transcription factor 8-like [Tarenaya hassleriana]|uniref:GATA transcription factor 8-like n=1 Tax=Tarenaya hassleriana TaxID=28532 RepID=UPI00053C9CCC|nr:PREDICTED: GATA transcription factor 8-like [Tarenaya hassleriana]
MIGQSFADEMDCGNFFDNMDDLIDFPNEDIGLGFGMGDNDVFPSIWSAQPESWPGSDQLFSSKNNSDSPTELYVPFANIVQLEQPSGFVDDSCSDKKGDSSSIDTECRSSSPVSVLESSSSSSQTANLAEPITGKLGRPRTKRPRPVIQEPNEEEKERESNAFSGFSGAESRLVIRIPKHLISEHENSSKKKKKKTAKVSPSSSSSSSSSSCLDQDHGPSSSDKPVRKCMHCEVTKTPQWRLGPMGPKTLCNACGVRYKSGRLFPEYRPAASPTFMPSLHSNSHKKVVEMRSMRCNGNAIDDELIPNNNAHIAIDYV